MEDCPIGKGLFEFEFSTIEEMRSVWSTGSWNLKFGILRLSQWVPDFCPDAQKQSNVQVWIRLSDLPREYWREKTLIEMPISLDEPTRHKVFGHYARLLVDVDLSKPLHNNILIEREGFAFHVGVVYEKHPEYCNNCQTLDHHISQCNKLKHGKNVASNKQDKPKAQEAVITKKLTNQGEKNPKIVASLLPSFVANAEILDTNIDSLATKNHDVDLIPIVELDGNTVLPDSPSNQSKIDNIREEASNVNLCHVELNKDVDR